MFYHNLPKHPYLYALADQNRAMAETNAAKFGAEKAYGDWRELVNDPQVDIVDITSPTICIMKWQWRRLRRVSMFTAKNPRQSVSNKRVK